MRLGRTADATTYGRQIAAAAVAVLATLLLIAPGATAAVGATTAAKPPPYVPPALLDAATANPDQVFRVIVQGRPNAPVATVEAGVNQTLASAPAAGDGVNGSFASIGAVAAEMTGLQIQLLAGVAGNIFAITPDMPVRASVADPPVALEPPAISGAAETGVALFGSPGQWSGADNAYSYQWQRCDSTSACTDIPGAIDPAYAVNNEDIGSTLVVVVTAANADGTSSSTSAPTAVVTAPAPVVQIVPPAPLAQPVVTGSAVDGDTLSVDAGTWSGGAISVALQWQRCSAAGDGCQDIVGAVGPMYSLGPDDVGFTIRVVVTATDALGTNSANSNTTAVVAAAAAAPAPTPPTALVAPSVSGTATAGETLTAEDGSWTGIVTTARQWQRCLPDGETCTDIAGAVGTTYVLDAADVGSTVRVAVTATDGSAGAAAVSAATGVVADAAPAPAPPPPPPPAPVGGGESSSGTGGGGGVSQSGSTPPLNVTLPAANGTPIERSQLEATQGTWRGDDGLQFTYRWERCDAGAGALCTTVGSTESYTVTGADVGSKLRAVVTATDNEGRSASATSDATDRIAPYSPSGFWSWQLGPYAAKVDAQWTAVDAAHAKPPAIAVVDSGVDGGLPGLEGSVARSVTLTTLPQGTAPDGYGHGSFVAQVAAGHGKGEAGAAPNAPIVSLDVMNDDGMALTSDVVAAADWIYEHKAEDNIRVANFSLIGSSPSSIMFDPLNRAIEHLWLSGVVVVTASGNFAVDGQRSDVPFSPANDPLAITVGATDPAGTVSPSDDFAAPWSAYGHTLDGFAKPELGAPGRYIVESVPTDSTLYAQRASAIVGPGQLQLSGTSFAAPLVSGVAADLLALHPDWTPDQVKGALMLSAAQPSAATDFSLGVGEVDAAAALAVSDPPNPNAALEQFVVPDPSGGTTPIFDAASWGTTARANASWGTASWGTASWGTASWGTASWGTDYWSAASWGTASWGTASWGTSTASWGTAGTASWGTASWGTASWGTASWGTASWGTDNANADVLPAGGYWMTWPVS